MGRPNPGAGPQGSSVSKDLGEARRVNQEAKKVVQTLGRIQDRKRSTKKYWGNIVIPRVAPDRSVEELRELEDLLKQVGVANEIASLNLETEEDILQSLEGVRDAVKDTKNLSGEEKDKIRRKIEAVLNEITN